MNDNAKKWVAALRSGEYKQRQDSLKGRNSSYCCLGVACSLAAKAGLDIKELDGEFSASGRMSRNYLPDLVREWLGLNNDSGSYKAPGPFDINTSLAYKNDTGLNFSQIADIIESEPEGLFKHVSDVVRL